MAEPSNNVRLVRCPKCENLLPELPDYSVYQCGGCGAVLRAKKSELDGDMGGLTGTPVDAAPGAVSDEPENFLAEPKKPTGNPVPTVENGEVAVSDNDGSSSGDVAERKETTEKCGGLDNGVVDEMCRTQQLKNGSLKSTESDRLKPQVEDVNGSLSSIKKSTRQKTKEKDGGGKLNTNRGEYEYQSVRFPPSNPAGEGTSSRYRYPNVDHRSTTEPGSISAECARPPNREELLRKLDELKEQLNQSCEVNSKSNKEKEPTRMFHAQDPYADYPDFPSGYRRRSRQFHDLNESGGSRLLPRYYHDPVPAVDRYGRSYGLLAQDDSSGGYENNSSDPHLLCRPVPRRILAYPQNPRSSSHPYFTGGQYGNPEPDLFEPDPFLDNNRFPCSCYQCYHKQIQIHPSAYRRYPPLGANNNKPFPCHHENYRVFPPPPPPPHGGGGGGYDSRISHSRAYIGSYEPPPPHLPPNMTRWPNDLNLEMNEIPPHSQRPSKVTLTSSRGRPCQPIAGGAPFITCHNCFELLELPKKISHLDHKTQWKVCCGNCSTLISFTLVDEKLVPVDLPQKKDLKDAPGSSGEVVHDKPYDPHSGMRRDTAGFHSEEFDNSTCDDFQAMDDKEHVVVVSSRTVHQVGSNLSKSEELHNHHLLSSSTSEEDDYIIHGNLVNESELPMDDDDDDNDVLLSTMPFPPHQEQYDFPRRAVNRCGKGSLSSRSDQERVKPALRQNSLQESLATEMEISHNDYEASLDTNNNNNNADLKSKEEDQPKGKKGVDSFFAGIIKKSFRDFSKSNNIHTGESRKRNITINGHVIPDRLLKKAEKLAGPVSPGQYWYDYRAGFWGLMGGPCLGIIPPRIEEFNYPMPVKCAGGDTSVFVNGRELHQKDLELLASRGLPTTRHRSYIIEISGKVLDGDSGEELDGLGKLAPTIEKVKHGFGMRYPSASVKCK